MTDKKAFDLTSLDPSKKSNDGAEFQLRHPSTNAPLGIFVTVLGKESDVFREHIRETTNKRIRDAALAQRRGKDADVPSAEEMEAKAIDLLVMCTVGWRTGEANTINFEGQALEFNVPNARKIYSRLSWMRGQVDEAIGSFELFI